jgi:hypothetical protein
MSGPGSSFCLSVHGLGSAPELKPDINFAHALVLKDSVLYGQSPESADKLICGKLSVHCRKAQSELYIATECA